MRRVPIGRAAQARLGGAARFLASCVVAGVAVFTAIGPPDDDGSRFAALLLLGGLVAAGAMSGRWTALAIPFVLACVVPGLQAGEALIEGQLFESDADDADGRSNALLAVVTLVLSLAGAVPAAGVVAVGVLLRRLVARISRSRRERRPAAERRVRRRPSEGAVIAAITFLALVGAALAQPGPPATAGGSSPAAPISCPGEPPFEAYYVGTTFGGLPLDQVTRSCESSVEFTYTDCDTCRDIPLEIFSQPLCEGFINDERNRDLLTDGRDPNDAYYVRTRILGVPGVRLSGGEPESGVSFEVYTGRTAVVVQGADSRLAENAVRALRRAPGKHVPLEDFDSLTEFEDAPGAPVRRLRPPPDGLFDGKVCTEIDDARERRLERKRGGTRRRSR